MGLHHVAFATKDLRTTHAFYTEAMGFRLAKVEAGPTESGGWAKHVFYDTGGSGGPWMIAFWELHDEKIGDGFRTDLSKSLGLPAWVNHLAFTAVSAEDLAQRRDRWREQGIAVVEVDHGWCRSIYATDPNRILVEFCLDTRPLTEADAAEAARLLEDPAPPLEPAPEVVVHQPLTRT